jgi:hypothetical protein
MMLRSSTGKRSRLQYSADGFTHSPSCEEQQGNRQGVGSTAPAPLSAEEAADILVSFRSHKRHRTNTWQAQQESAQQESAQQAALNAAHQAAQQAAQHQQAGLSTSTPDIAAIAAAATALLAQSGHPRELLIEACHQLATHYFALDAAQVAAQALSVLADQPPLQPLAQHTRTPTKKYTAAKQPASPAAGMPTPFAAMACGINSRQASPDSTAVNNSAGEDSTESAKVWTEAHLAKLAPLKIQHSAATSAVLPVHTPKAAAHTPKAAPQAWAASPGSSARSTASPLQPGLMNQCFSGGVAAWTSGSQPASPGFGSPVQERLHTYADDRSVVSLPHGALCTDLAFVALT